MAASTADVLAAIVLCGVNVGRVCADIVFDMELFPALVSVLGRLLKR